MSDARDRLGLVLPLPLLLATPSSALAQPAQAEAPPLAEPGQAEGSPLAEPSPAAVLTEAKALYERGEASFVAGDFLEAGQLLERAAALAPLPLLYLDAAIAFRFAATAEPQLDRAAPLCEATRRHADAVLEHRDATQEQRERATAERALAEAHCATLADADTDPTEWVGPCLQPPIEPCLSIIEPRGCAHRRGGDVAMMGSLMLLGLRSRRRREAVERVAERLPPDVAAALRRRSDTDDEPQ